MVELVTRCQCTAVSEPCPYKMTAEDLLCDGCRGEGACALLYFMPDVPVHVSGIKFPGWSSSRVG